MRRLACEDAKVNITETLYLGKTEIYLYQAKAGKMKFPESTALFKNSQNGHSVVLPHLTLSSREDEASTGVGRVGSITSQSLLCALSRSFSTVALISKLSHSPPL